MSSGANVFAQSFFHGTRADLKPGDLIVVGHPSNFTDVQPLSWVYFAATLDAAIWGAELAVGTAPGRIYVVEPTGPVVEYLARSLSAFYALVGALCLVMASDLDRYSPLVRFFGVCLALLGIVLTGVDLAAGMPWWWTALEGPGSVPIGALVYFLARPVSKPCKQEEITCQPPATSPF